MLWLLNMQIDCRAYRSCNKCWIFNSLYFAHPEGKYLLIKCKMLVLVSLSELFHAFLDLAFWHLRKHLVVIGPECLPDSLVLCCSCDFSGICLFFFWSAASTKMLHWFIKKYFPSEMLTVYFGIYYTFLVVENQVPGLQSFIPSMEGTW